MKAWAVIVALVGVLWAGLAWSQTNYRWSQIKKGSGETNSTVATSLNDAEWFVGRWSGHADPFDEGGAFRMSKGTFIEFKVPGAEDAQNVHPERIRKSSTIVGTYFLDPPCDDGCGDGTLHAFLYRHGLNDHILIDVPGAFWTFPLGLNNLRQVGLGYFAEPDPDVTTWGAAIYDYATNTFTPVTVLGHEIVVIRGINDTGDLAGVVDVLTEDGCGCNFAQFAFVRIAGEDQLLEPPAWARSIHPMGINNARVVVGMAEDHAGQVSGFRLDLATGTWEQIVHPTRREGFQTYVVDINNKGQMLAVNERLSDGFTLGYWIRPIK